MKVTLVIPALDEAAVIGDLVRRVPPGMVREVIVVDNGSVDATGAATARARTGRRPHHDVTRPAVFTQVNMDAVAHPRLRPRRQAIRPQLRWSRTHSQYLSEGEADVVPTRGGDFEVVARVKPVPVAGSRLPPAGC
jgi:glycosyltransferase involved in cell wall biosynthesis